MSFLLSFFLLHSTFTLRNVPHFLFWPGIFQLSQFLFALFSIVSFSNPVPYPKDVFFSSSFINIRLFLFTACIITDLQYLIFSLFWPFILLPADGIPCFIGVQNPGTITPEEELWMSESPWHNLQAFLFPDYSESHIEERMKRQFNYCDVILYERDHFLMISSEFISIA